MESLFVGSEILDSEQGVSCYDSYKTQSAEIESFCENLCSDQNIRFSFLKIADNLLDIAAALCCIAVKSGYSGLREECCRLFFDLLCAGAQAFQFPSAFAACADI